MKILYQGSPGAYSHLAANELYPNAEIVALCDTNIDLAKNRAKKWGCSESTKIVDELDKVLKDINIDMVELLLPHHMHLNAALKAIDLSKSSDIRL